jgi:hypothetical protein
MAIWVIKDGQREGPYEEQDVRELIYEGTYSDSDSAIRDGQFDWSTLGQLLGRQPLPAEPSAYDPIPLSAAEPPPLLLAPEHPLLSAIPEAEPPPIPGSSPELPSASLEPISVAVTDFQMPFGSMVLFMVKWVIASIPALLILFAIAALFWSVCIAFIAILVHH